jgi:hypothetical protein
MTFPFTGQDIVDTWVERSPVPAIMGAWYLRLLLRDDLGDVRVGALSTETLQPAADCPWFHTSGG